MIFLYLISFFNYLYNFYTLFSLFLVINRLFGNSLFRLFVEAMIFNISFAIYLAPMMMMTLRGPHFFIYVMELEIIFNGCDGGCLDPVSSCFAVFRICCSLCVFILSLIVIVIAIFDPFLIAIFISTLA